MISSPQMAPPARAVRRRPAARTRNARRLPPGVGLAIGAVVSLGLWAALGQLVLPLVG